MVQRLGIIGGLGPETSSKFCLNINQRFRKITLCQPNIVLENVPVPLHVEQSLIQGKNNEDMLVLLERAIDNLNNNKTDFIVIPCNTVHIFIDTLRKRSTVPIVSIIEESSKRCVDMNLQKVGLLATQKSIESELFNNEFKKVGISILLPTKPNQQEINKSILRIVDGKATKNDKKVLMNSISELVSKNADAILLGCTDLSIVISDSDCSIPVLDTCKILEDSTVDRMVEI